jgi:Ala-tRNA(Pro) deacylase
MPILTKLSKFLDEQKVTYEVHSHPERFTANAVAEAEHVPAREMAKVVILRAGREYLMVVVPASFRVDIGLLRHQTGKPDLHLATEGEFASLFPGCELGAMPPFGNLFGLPVWIDTVLAKQKAITFNAGTHRQAVHMAYTDFARLVQPKVLALSDPERK